MTIRWLARGELSLPADDAWLSELERTRAAMMRFTKRRSEYLVARWTLKNAVARALEWSVDAAELARIEARHACDGAPELYVDGRPAPFDVSLTDRAGWAVCIVAPTASDPGCDLELVEPRSLAFVADYLTSGEQQLVMSAVQESGPASFDLAANLVWSAKESALKVLRTGLRRDTRSVEVTLSSLTPPDRTWSPLSVRTDEGERFDGWWRRSGDFLLTTCARMPLAPPISFDADVALDDAVPLHTWTAVPRSNA